MRHYCYDFVISSPLVLISSEYIKKFKIFGSSQIDSSTIDGNVEFVHSQYSCILTSQVSNIKRKTKFSHICWHVFQD